MLVKIMGHLLKAGVMPGILEHLGVKRVPDRRSAARTATTTTATICTCGDTVQPRKQQQTFRGKWVRLVQPGTQTKFAVATQVQYKQKKAWKYEIGVSVV